MKSDKPAAPPGWRGRHRGQHRRTSVADEPSVGQDARTGRNVPLAIIVGLGMGAVALVPLLFYRPAFVLLVAAAAGIAIWELTSAISAKQARPPLVPVLVGGVGTIIVTWFTGVEALVVGVLITIFAVILWRLPDGPHGYGRDVTAATLITIYVPFLASFVVLLAEPDDGALRVIAFLVVTICSDTGGLIVGSWWGRHRMAPVVSPHKSWEGFAGSVGLCLIAGIGFLTFGFDGTHAWQGALFGIAIALAATLGDLAESLIKRDLGIKDMGHLLPAHGGLMDRFDSLLTAAPIAYLLLTVFAPPS